MAFEITRMEFITNLIGKRNFTADGGVTPEGLSLLLDDLEKNGRTNGYKLPWVSHNVQMGNGVIDSVAYSMFPLNDTTAYDFYTLQESTLWTAKELRYLKDKEEFPGLPERYKKLYYDLFGFFSPGDGLVSKNLLRFMSDCKTFSESLFFNIQLFVETVHSEAYGMSITAVIPDIEEQKKVFGMIDTLPCVAAKANFFKKYIDSDLSKAHRYIAAAVTERVFFVSLFAMVFYMRKKNVLTTFTFLNEQVSKDETLHGDFYCAMAVKEGLPERKEIIEIIDEGVQVEIEYLKYVLREPIDSPEEDEIGGITIDNLTRYVKLLADHVLILLGMPTHYNVEVELPWMGDMSHSRKSNFYERQVGSYRKFGKDSANWRAAIGLEKSQESDPVLNPDDVDF